MGLLSELKGIATELLDLSTTKIEAGPSSPAPYVPAVHLGRDENGYSVYEMRAGNYAEAGRGTTDSTVEGPVHKALIWVGHNRWQSRVDCNDTHGLK